MDETQQVEAEVVPEVLPKDALEFTFQLVHRGKLLCEGTRKMNEMLLTMRGGDFQLIHASNDFVEKEVIKFLRSKNAN